MFLFALTVQAKILISKDDSVSTETVCLFFIHFFPHNQRPDYKGEHNLLIYHHTMIPFHPNGVKTPEVFPSPALKSLLSNSDSFRLHQYTHEHSSLLAW